MSETTQRIDKWLWAARFFKTRSLAAQAVSGGKVLVEDPRVNPARQVTPGTRLRVRKGSFEVEVVINALSRQRGPAPEAQLLYEETPRSIELRRQEQERRRAAQARRAEDTGRPDKKGRRELIRMKRS